MTSRKTKKNNKKKKMSAGTNTKHGEKIKRFIMSRRTALTARFLKSICSDSGECIVFGKETEKIKKFFQGFSNFNHVQFPIVKIAKGSNGYVHEIKYRRENYSATALLKSTLDPEADNLIYEYLVGKYINKKRLLFPCFLETYGVFQYANEDAHHIFSSSYLTKSDVNFDEDLIPIQDTDPDFFAISCKNSLYLTVLVEYIHEAIPIRTMANLPPLEFEKFVNNELVYILFQVYMPLSMLVDEYTHYDLHDQNILLYKPLDRKYIQYHYHLSDGSVVTFKSRYLVKIIDYGRSYFYENETKNSLQIFNTLCQTKECNQNGEFCGIDSGFSILAPEEKEGAFHFISSQKSNKSHDLRLLNELRKKIKKSPSLVLPEITDFFKRIVYSEDYGTKARDSDGTNTIYNVVDAFHALVKLTNPVRNEKTYKSFTKVGDLHVTGNSPCRFEPHSPNTPLPPSPHNPISLPPPLP